MILKGLWKEPGIWNMEQRDLIPLWKSSSYMACRETYRTAAGLNQSDWLCRPATHEKGRVNQAFKKMEW